MLAKRKKDKADIEDNRIRHFSKKKIKIVFLTVLTFAGSEGAPLFLLARALNCASRRSVPLGTPYLARLQAGEPGCAIYKTLTPPVSLFLSTGSQC